MTRNLVVGAFLGAALAVALSHYWNSSSMIYHWFERLKLLQSTAPDDNYKPNPDALDTKSDFWSIVAPDPKFTPQEKQKKEPEIEPSSNKKVLFSPTMTVHHHPGSLESHHSGGRTEPITSSPFYSHSALTTPTLINDASSPGGNPNSGSSRRTPRKILLVHDPKSTLPVEVMEACKRVSDTRHLLANRRDDLSRNVFGRVSNAMTEKAKSQLRLRIRIDPNLLVRRSYQPTLRTNCPDGSTIFMTAIFSKQLDNVKFIWEIAKELQTHEYQLQCTNIVGETAWHAATLTGDHQMISYITSLYHEVFGENAIPPQDLMGYTPLASGTVHNTADGRASAKKVLYSETDPSVTGTPHAQDKRSVLVANAELGMSEVNGQRCHTEDYTVVDTFNNDTILVAVADGHDDNGDVASFVANGFIEAIIPVLQKPIADWTEKTKLVCLALDDEVRAQAKGKMVFGGAVAIFCVVTPTQIVVANVGDCRAILIQGHRESSEVDGLVAATEQLSITENGEAAKSTKPLVVALSEDHKPDLKDEKERILGVDGMDVVVEQHILENGETIVVPRIVDTKSTTKAPIAFSRSFGDFEYKTTKHLDVTAQALIAIPETVVRDRQGNDLYVVLACDGLWDVMENTDVAEFINARPSLKPVELADQLVAEALRLGSSDNISVVVINLQGKFGLHDTKKQLFDTESPLNKPEPDDVVS